MKNNRLFSLWCSSVLTIGLIISLFPFNAESSTLRDTFFVPELDDEVKVYWDEYGIPHIYAATEHDLFFVNGFIHAKMRLIEMDFTRRLAQGHLSELVGNDTLGDDKEARHLKLNVITEEKWNALRQREKELLQAYSDGINKYLEVMPQSELPVEYVFLDPTFTKNDIEPWVPQDTMAILVYMTIPSNTLDMGDDFSLERRFKALDATYGPPGGPDPRSGFGADIMLWRPPVLVSPQYGHYSPPTPKWFTPWPDFSIRPKISDRVIQSVLEMCSRSPFLNDNRTQMGSNGWAVKSCLTKNGYPLVAADPHLALQMPPLFFQIHLNTEDKGGIYQVVGVNLPGLPGVAIGATERCAWAMTNGNADVTDTFVEKVVKDSLGDMNWVVFEGNLVHIERRLETIYVKTSSGMVQHDEWVYEVPHHGPILQNSYDPDANQAISFRNVGYVPSEEITAFLNLPLVRDVWDFKDNLQYVKSGQAFVAADVNDNVLYFNKYQIPKRNPNGLTEDFPPYLPYPGTGGYEWLGLMADENLPWVINPDWNYCAAANSDPNGCTFDNNPLPTDPGDYYFGDVFDIGFRLGRITELIENGALDRPAGEKMSFEFFRDIQGDNKSALGERMLPHILTAAQNNPNDMADPMDMQMAVQLLSHWDLSTPDGITDPSVDMNNSVATTIFNAWLIRCARNTIKDELDAAGAGYISGNGTTIGFRGFLEIFENGGAVTDMIAFDDMNTAVVETKDEIILKSLQQAIDYMETRFETPDMKQWIWGELHTLTLEHFTGVDVMNVPPPTDPDFPDGFPRHGDRYNIDSCDFSISRDDYTYDHGPVVRIVSELRPGDIRVVSNLPGGQDGHLNWPHYKDEMEYWRKNEYHPIWIYTNDVLQNAQEYDVFTMHPPTVTPAPTNTATPSPTAEATQTPTPSEKPVILVAGYMTTSIPAATGGPFQICAILDGPVDKVYLAVRGQPTAIELADQGGGLYCFSTNIPGPLQPTRISIEIIAISTNGVESNLWPYLNVE